MFKPRFNLFLIALALSMPMLGHGEQAKQTDAQWQAKFKRDLDLKLKNFKTLSKKHASSITIAAGNQVWHKGSQFSNSKNWFGLSCFEYKCKWVPAALSVKKQNIWVGWGKYDTGYEELLGQTLSFTSNQSGLNHHVVLWVLRKPHSPAWLGRGEVSAYYFANSAAVDAKLIQSQLSFEVRFKAADGLLTEFYPMQLVEGQADNGLMQGETFIQVRQSGKRQFLLASLSASECEQSDIKAVSHYLKWAGDIDQDGKTDYIVNFSPNENNVHLYLSSRAQLKDMVGLAGVFDARQSMTGCF